jgi:predicted enzyme related to lactoylglutathione lyase
MTDVRTDAAPATAESRANPQGDFIWYELMTPDPEGSKAFYDAVVGWDISGEGPPEYNGYRMIGRSDGGFAGGVLPLTAEMQQNGARPTWLGYIHVPDVDAKVASIEAAGGKALVPAIDIPNVGRIAMVADPQGAAFYVMKPIPPANDPNAQSDLFSPTAEQRVGWNELQTTDQAAARSFYGAQFGWGSDEFMDMGEMGEYRFWDHHGTRLGAVFHNSDEGFEAKNDARSRWRYYIRVPSIASAKQTVEDKGGTVAMGPHQVPTGDWIIVGSDPQGAEFALVGGK